MSTPHIPRRTMFQATAVAGTALLSGASLLGTTAFARPSRIDQPYWIGAGAVAHVYDASGDGGPKRYLNDHCTIQGPDGTWHLFSIIGDSAPPGEFPDPWAEDHIAHATAPDLSGPWTTHEPVLTTDPDYHGEDHLWAPHVIEHDGTYYMFYSAGGDGAAINLATSQDLTTWTRLDSGPLFRGAAARDAFVLRVGEEWVMYYCEVDGARQHIVAARTSTDLHSWSEPRTIYTDPTNDDTSSITESPFVVERDGWWYLFIGPRNGYDGTDVFASQDPFAFTSENYAGHVPVHCAEVVNDGEDWWITAAGSFHDGLYLAPLHWRDSPPLWHSPANPAAAADITGTVRIFALATDRSTLLIRARESGWEEFGADFATVPTLGVGHDGRLHAFALRATGELAARGQGDDGSWQDWRDFGGPFAAAPAAASDVDGRIHLFALGPAGENLWHRRQLEPGDDEWSDWEEFGGPSGAPPVAATNADGRLEVLALGPGGAYLTNRWQDTPGGDWHDWDDTFGSPAAGAPTLARGAGDLLNVMAIAPIGTGLHHRSQAEPSHGWREWYEFGSWTDAAATMVAGEDGRLAAFFMPPGGHIVHHQYQNPDGSWGERETFDEEPSSVTPSACRDAEGMIHVFAVSADGTLRTRAQTAPNDAWGEWELLDGDPIAPVAAGSAT